MKSENKKATVFSVGGGKDGVGKSLLAIGLAAALSRAGRTVVLADLDLGMANLHTYLGIRGRTPTIADFVLGKVSSLAGILVRTSIQNVGLISGAEFVPGMADPAHWTKMRLMRQLRSLPVDVVILDLGAGAQFDTLDFFSMSDRGIVVTAPDPGALTNAYGFVKGALFRKIQGVLSNHSGISRAIEGRIKTGDDRNVSLEWFSATLNELAPGLVPVVGEIGQSFSPALVINGAPAGTTHPVVRNLVSLCKDRLGITLEHVGDIPETREISNHLLNVPRFFNTRDGEPYFYAVSKIAQRLAGTGIHALLGQQAAPFVMEDEDRDEIARFLDTLDDSVFTSAGRDTWKLRMFYKPADVITYLISRGVTHRTFSNYQ